MSAAAPIAATVAIANSVLRIMGLSLFFTGCLLASAPLDARMIRRVLRRAVLLVSNRPSWDGHHIPAAEKAETVFAQQRFGRCSSRGPAPRQRRKWVIASVMHQGTTAPSLRSLTSHQSAALDPEHSCGSATCAYCCCCLQRWVWRVAIPSRRATTPSAEPWVLRGAPTDMTTAARP